MNTSDFNFDLPQELIAQHPLEDRASSRLLVIDRKTGDTSHFGFRDIKKFLKKGDCLVINDTKVIPARLLGTRKKGTSSVEILLLRRIDQNRWECLVYPGKKARVGHEIIFGDGRLSCTIEEIIEDGNRVVRFVYSGIFEEILDELGQMPLPPYITEKLADKTRYQTVYAVHDGSAAAPTAGLHFTNELLYELEDMGIKIAKVTLHVGLGTFRPVKVENVTEHKMHSEYCIIEADQAEIINDAKAKGGKIIAVGTTSLRTLESFNENGRIMKASGETDIFIYPGFVFQVVDGLITNFHLPESTLIMLVSALCSREIILKAYQEAIENRYRFFSFGDACLII